MHPDPPRPLDRELLRPSEAAAALGISRAKLYRLLARGELRSRKIDAATRIHLDDLHAYLARRVRVACAAAPDPVARAQALRRKVLSRPDWLASLQAGWQAVQRGDLVPIEDVDRERPAPAPE